MSLWNLDLLPGSAKCTPGTSSVLDLLLHWFGFYWRSTCFRPEWELFCLICSSLTSHLRRSLLLFLWSFVIFSHQVPSDPLVSSFLFQDSPDPGSYSSPASPTLPIQPPAAAPTSTVQTAPTPGGSCASGAQRRAQALRLGALIAELEKTLRNQSLTEKELRALDHQILHLATILKVPGHVYTESCFWLWFFIHVSSCSPSERPLPAEKLILWGDAGRRGSPGQLRLPVTWLQCRWWHFLSGQPETQRQRVSFQTERRNSSETHSNNLWSFLSVSISSFQQSTLRSRGLLSHHSQSASEEELAIAPLTSGNWGLDQALETHLDICLILLQVQDVHQRICFWIRVHISSGIIQKKHETCLYWQVFSVTSFWDSSSRSSRSSDDRSDWLQPVEDGPAGGDVPSGRRPGPSQLSAAGEERPHLCSGRSVENRSRHVSVMFTCKWRKRFHSPPPAPALLAPLQSFLRPRERGMCCCSGRIVRTTAAPCSAATPTASSGRWRNATRTRWRPSSPANQRKVDKHSCFGGRGLGDTPQLKPCPRPVQCSLSSCSRCRRPVARRPAPGRSAAGTESPSSSCRCICSAGASRSWGSTSPASPGKVQLPGSSTKTLF